LVTGRSFHHARPIADLLALPLTLIVNNGAVVKTTAGWTLTRYVLPRDEAREVLDLAADWTDSVAMVFDREPGPDEHRQIVFDQMDWEHPHRRAYFAKNRAFIARTSPLAAALTEDPIQVMFNGRVEPMRELAARLGAASSGAFSINLTEYEDRDFSLLDVNRAGCSKGSTLASWAAGEGVVAADTLAIGDNLNDLDMLEHAGVAVIMGNAAPALKRRGFHETGTNDEGGLAEAVARFVLDRTP
jgi:HAD superfamily hydrolase (TIGR01484 family)